MERITNNPWLITIAGGLVVEIIVALYKKSRIWTVIGIIALIIIVIPISLKLSSNSKVAQNQIPQPSTSELTRTPITTPTPKPLTSSIAANAQTTSPYTTVQIVPGTNVSASIQSSSNVLTLGTTTKDEGLYFTTTYTLSGYIKAVITNPTPNDITGILVTIDFQLSKVPSLDSSTIQLTSDIVSWTLITVNPDELKFQTSKWGVNLNSGQKLTLPLTITISQSQRSAIASNPWQQSYPFTVSASVK